MTTITINNEITDEAPVGAAIGQVSATPHADQGARLPLHLPGICRVGEAQAVAAGVAAGMFS